MKVLPSCAFFWTLMDYAYHCIYSLVHFSRGFLMGFPGSSSWKIWRYSSSYWWWYSLTVVCLLFFLFAFYLWFIVKCFETTWDSMILDFLISWFFFDSAKSHVFVSFLVFPGSPSWKIWTVWWLVLCVIFLVIHRENFLKFCIADL